MPRLLTLLWLLVLFGGALEAAAQSHAFVPTGSWPYRYIRQLQHRGHLLELHPTALPYTRAALREALADVAPERLSAPERRWVRMLASFLGDAGPAGTALGAAAEAGLVAADSDRRDPLRPTDAASPTLRAGRVRLFPNAAVEAWLAHDRFVALGALRFDVYYRDDPDGLDAANRLISRNEGYLGYDGRIVAAHLGRVRTHWAPSAAPGLLVSDNPYPYDALHLRIGGERLALRSLLGELDSVTADGRFTGAAGADSVAGSERRHLAAHRLDWRPSRRLALTLLEANLYSGTSSTASLRYLNPLQLHLVLVDNPPKNDENNGLIAAMLWAQAGRTTLHGQLVVDDFDILAQTGEPASAALSAALHYAALAPWADVGLRLTAVSSRAYNTHQPEGKYVYLLRGLATEFSDYFSSSLFLPLYLDALAEGLTVTPAVDWLVQGERAIEDPYPRAEDDVAFIATGTAERTLRVGAELFYQPDPRFWVALDVGVNRTSDAGHVEGATRTRFAGTLSFGTRLSLDRPLTLDLP